MSHFPFGDMYLAEAAKGSIRFILTMGLRETTQSLCFHGNATLPSFRAIDGVGSGHLNMKLVQFPG